MTLCAVPVPCYDHLTTSCSFTGSPSFLTKGTSLQHQLAVTYTCQVWVVWSRGKSEDKSLQIQSMADPSSDPEGEALTQAALVAGGVPPL